MSNKKEENRGTAGAETGSPVSLYIHFPFCVRKCRYCDFLSGPADESVREQYLKALGEEIRAGKELLNAFRNQNALLPFKNSSPSNSGTNSSFLHTEQKGTSDIQVGMAGSVYKESPYVDSIFFGGGTPSMMTAEQIERLLNLIFRNYRVDDHAEITLECNPGTVDKEKLKDFRHAGINRLSIGVQSFRDPELLMLGRIHTAEQAIACFKSAREAGFDNLSIDLISALPGQTYEEWMYSLKQAAKLEPEHISAYSLILEEGTPLRKDYEKGLLPSVPEEDLDRKMYHDTKTFLARYGYHRYEISNYAKEGFESRHNSGYWTGHQYLGLGLGASSYLFGKDGGRFRWNNVRDLSRYCSFWKSVKDLASLGPLADMMCQGENHTDAAFSRNECKKQKTDQGERISAPEIRERNNKKRQEISENSPEGSPYENMEELSIPDQMGEFMFLGLRRMEGVSFSTFRNRFGKPMEAVYGQVICRYENLGLLVQKGDHLSLTDHGIDVSNTVMADFLLV